MTRTLFRDATILTMADGVATMAGDLLVDGSTIRTIAPRIEPAPDMVVIEAGGRLLMPGLVNSHTHSSETFFRGRYERMPLEIWLLYAYPLLMGAPIGPRLLYLRSLLLAMESLRSGVTTMCDDFFDPPVHDLERLGTVFRAYEDAGIRANVSSAVMDIHPLDALPWGRETMPAALQAKLDFGPPIGVEAYLDYCRAAAAAFDGRAGRLKFMIAPSAPQRCTRAMLEGCHDLARTLATPFHTHVVETKTQAVGGRDFEGGSLVAYMAGIGVLSRNTTIAHSVWVSDDDMDLMGEAGCSIAHNAVSNLKLGAGVAPVRRLLDAGVTVGLGTDGVSSNDTARIFDVMRVAALVQGAAGPDYAQWLSAEEILRAATIGGARSAMLEGVTGTIEEGKAADLLMLDLDTYAFMPLNDVTKHLVFSENGSSVRLVMVNGEVVVRDGRVVSVDEAAILAEIREAMPAFLGEHARLEEMNRVFEPYMAAVHRRASEVDLGMYRYAGDMKPWTRQNIPAG